MKLGLEVLVFLELLVSLCGGWAAAAVAVVVDESLQHLRLGAKADIIVTLANSTEPILARIGSQEYASREDRLNTLSTELQNHAALNQAHVLRVLGRFKSIRTKSNWVCNQVHVKGANFAVIAALRFLREIKSIRKDYTIPLANHGEFEPISSTAADFQKFSDKNTYGLDKVRAPNVWNIGFRGQGIVVGQIDTGVRYTHETLISKYRGEYGWYDPYAGTEAPIDENGHGTHTMGTLVGGKGIGVAPQAEWMACRGCYINGCDYSTLMDCGQFMLCPTLPDGSQRNCAKAPSVVSNSWGGLPGDTFFNCIINAWVAARIIPVFAIGNSGPNCSTARSPGDQPNVISVGATDSNDHLAKFSSVGPSVTTGQPKPDLVAPGVQVISAFNNADDGYAIGSGTSMSTPHVAGIVALIQSKRKLLHQQHMTFDQVYRVLTQGADNHQLVGTGTGQNCGRKSGAAAAADWPNNSFGWGRANSRRSIDLL